MEKYAVAPWAMEGILEYIKQNYGNPPVYILENGKPMKQDLQLQQNDTARIEYLHEYIGAVLKAVRNGSDTSGYFVWSFMDLYENSFGLYSISAIHNARDLPNSLIIGTLVSSRVKPPFLVPKVSRNCRATYLLPLR